MRGQRIATLNKPGKFEPGSRPTELCLVAAGYATDISSRPRAGKLIHEFFRGKSDAEIIANYSGE